MTGFEFYHDHKCKFSTKTATTPLRILEFHVHCTSYLSLPNGMAILKLRDIKVKINYRYRNYPQLVVHLDLILSIDLFINSWYYKFIIL